MNRVLVLTMRALRAAHRPLPAIHKRYGGRWPGDMAFKASQLIYTAHTNLFFYVSRQYGST